MPVILAKWARQYGPVAQFRVMGTPQVIISDERIANDLFVKRGNIYSDRGAPHAVEHISMNQNPGFRPKDSKPVTLLFAKRSSMLILIRRMAPPEKSDA